MTRVGSGSKAPTLDAIAQFRYEREQLGFREHALLRKRGWNYVCNTPGSYWLWERKLEDGRTLLVDTQLALNMETLLCGEEYDDDEIGG